MNTHLAVALAVFGALAVAGCSGTHATPVTPVTPAPSRPPASLSAPASAPPSAAATNAGAGRARYSCDDNSAPFSPSLFDTPATAEREAHPAAERLRAAIAQREFTIEAFPDSGYWLVSRSPTSADYVARAARGDSPFVHAVFEMRNGTWALSAYGECRPTIALDDLSLASWTLDPAAPPPDPSTTIITALVTERACTGGKPMAGRLQAPSITYGGDAITVVFAAQPLVGGHDCPGNRSTRVVVELREALGDRRLLDGAFLPPADPGS